MALQGLITVTVHLYRCAGIEVDLVIYSVLHGVNHLWLRCIGTPAGLYLSVDHVTILGGLERNKARRESV